MDNKRRSNQSNRKEEEFLGDENVCVDLEKKKGEGENWREKPNEPYNHRWRGDRNEESRT